MRFIVDDLIPKPIDGMSHYECAITALRAISAEGFAKTDETFPPGQRQSVFIGKNRQPLVYMVEAAMHQIDPESCAYYNEANGTMQLEFSASFEKPPIRSLRSALEKFAESMLRQTKFDEESGYYIVAHDAQNTLDLCRFASLFASTEHPICYFYALPGTQPFTDAEGEVHVPGRLVDYNIMGQYLAAHPDADLPSMDAAQPLKVAIDKDTMQQMLDAMGAPAPEKSARRN